MRAPYCLSAYVCRINPLSRLIRAFVPSRALRQPIKMRQSFVRLSQTNRCLSLGNPVTYGQDISSPPNGVPSIFSTKCGTNNQDKIVTKIEKKIRRK